MSESELFLKYNYLETKELCLKFLTLVTAVLIFSLSFAEKVFDFRHASKNKRFIVIIGWSMFLLSIILCGVGLVYNSLAGGDAVYYQKDYEKLAQIAYLFIFSAGIIFTVALFLTIVSAIISKNNKFKKRKK